MYDASVEPVYGKANGKYMLAMSYTDLTGKQHHGWMNHFCSITHKSQNALLMSEYQAMQWRDHWQQHFHAHIVKCDA